MQGFIKLHRQLLDWEWYSDINVRVLFIHCLLRANHKDTKWQGKTIKKGSFITSYENLSIETGLTVREVRTAINKLKMTGELTHKGQAQYSVITINNWDKFQENDKQNDNLMTNERQANDKQATTDKNDKNEKNDKNDKNNIYARANIEVIKNSVDPYSDSLIEKCFDLYEQLCPDLCKIQYARRNRQIRELTGQVLTAIDKDIGVFEDICRKANELKLIADKPINYKKMLNCYEGILDGSYLTPESREKQEQEAAFQRFKAKKEAQRKEQERLNEERGIYQSNY